MRMNSIILLLLILLQSTISYQKNTQALWIENDDDCPCTELTEKIYNRYYIIARLTNMLEHLNRLNATHKKQLVQSLEHIDVTQFVHSAIIDCINRIQKQQRLDPLFTLWNHIDYYQGITDPEYTQEFIHLLALLMESLLQEIAPRSDQKLILLNQLLDDENYCKFTTMPDSQTPDQRLIYSIVFRFFLLHRLAKAIKLLEHFQKNKTPVFEESIGSCLELITDSMVKQSYALMLEQKTMEPLFGLWSRLESFDTITDFNHSKNFIMVLLFTYHTILHGHYSMGEQAPQLSISTECIAHKTTLELLELIDECVAIAHKIPLSTQPILTLTSLLKNSLYPFLRIKNWLVSLVKGSSW